MKKIVCFLLFSLIVNSCTDLNEKYVKVIELSNKSSRLYIKKVVWGLTGDSQRYYISKSSDVADTMSDPYFLLDFFYKLEDKSFFVFGADSLKRAKNLDTSIRLMQMELSDINYQNYKDHGLKSTLRDIK